jgi:hypothetical protein
MNIDYKLLVSTVETSSIYMMTLNKNLDLRTDYTNKKIDAWIDIYIF